MFQNTGVSWEAVLEKRRSVGTFRRAGIGARRNYPIGRRGLSFWFGIHLPCFYAVVLARIHLDYAAHFEEAGAGSDSDYLG